MPAGAIMMQTLCCGRFQPTQRTRHSKVRSFSKTWRIGISQNYLSTMERGKVEIGAEILLRISQEFAKSVEWLLTGKG